MRKKSILILAAVLLFAVSSMVLAADKSISVIVNVAKKVEVSEPGSIVLNILADVPVYTGDTSFAVKSNYAVNVDFQSKGYVDTIMNENISYSYTYSDNTRTFLPAGQGERLNLISGVNDVTFAATFDKSAVENDEWVNISADNDYSDVITVTVSAE